MEVAQILINGTWLDATGDTTFHAFNPSTSEALTTEFPISAWPDCDAALNAATEAAAILRTVSPQSIAAFLEAYAANIEMNATAIIEAAHEETGLPIAPRLKDVELPRTTNRHEKRSNVHCLPFCLRLDRHASIARFPVDCMIWPIHAKSLTPSVTKMPESTVDANLT